MDIAEIVVLLVEPSSTQQRIISNQFTELGIRTVLVAESGRVALDMIEREEPDLVVSSMYLPDMTGTDLVHEMRGTHDHAGMAFMLISSETDVKVLDPIRQAGAIAILPKPFAPKELEYAMNATLSYYNPNQVSLSNEDVEDIRVLVVDDSRMARKHIRRVLEKMGLMDITEAENGREALSMLGGNYFDLVVTDYNMPEMDGRELIDEIRQHTEQKNIPILMVTSEHDGSRLAAVKQAGVSAICDKPFETDTVRELLEGMLS